MLTLLRVLRIKANQSQADLAFAAGVAQPMVSNWESGLQLPEERGKAMLAHLSRFINVDNIRVEDLTKPYADTTDPSIESR